MPLAFFLKKNRQSFFFLGGGGGPFQLGLWSVKILMEKNIDGNIAENSSKDIDENGIEMLEEGVLCIILREIARFRPISCQACRACRNSHPLPSFR